MVTMTRPSWPRPPTPALRRVLVAAVVLSPAGCGLSFPDEKMIEDLRILEVRAEPPEIRFVQPGQTATTAVDFLRVLATAPNLETVRFSGLAAHPDLDATFAYGWGRCVPFQDLPCEDSVPEVITGTSSVVELSPIQKLIEDVADVERPDEALLAFTTDPRDLLNGVWAHILLSVRTQAAELPTDSPEIRGLKRLVIFDPLLVKVAILEARRLVASGQQMIPMIEGVQLPTLCTNVDEAQLAKIFAYLDGRAPNRAPKYTALQYSKRSFGVDTATAAVVAGEVIELAPGEELVMRGRAQENDKEPYQLIDDNCELQAFNETLAWSWFTNLGSLSKAITVEGATEDNRDGEEVIYSAPLRPDLRAEVTRARIWSVLRDGRGGSEARVVDVVIRR